MSTDNLIRVTQLCSAYNLEETWFIELDQHGIINTVTVENTTFILVDDLSVLEKVLRMNRDLNINLEGIDVIFNLLEKIDRLNNQLTHTKSRLKIYE